MNREKNQEEMSRRHTELAAGRLPIIDTTDIVARIHLERYRFTAQYVRNLRVLDIATGIGYGAFYLATDGGAGHVIGADISDSALASARAHYQRPNTEFVRVEGTTLPFPDASFDTVISLETLEHVADPGLFLSELRRVVKPGGTIVLSSPNKRFLSQGRRKPWNPHHVQEFYPHEFLLQVESHFGPPVFWGGQEFLPLDSRTIRHYNWIEFRYYYIREPLVRAGLWEPLLRAKARLFPRATPGPDPAQTPAADAHRTQVVPWQPGYEPYTMVAVCRAG
jgi:SAM-dependent methyltransferase